MARLKQMARASGIAVQNLTRGLKSEDLSDAEYISKMRSRLKKKGAVFAGELPTDWEIERAQEGKERKQLLDGIDSSAIIKSKRREAAPQVQVFKKRRNSMSESSSEAEFEC